MKKESNPVHADETKRQSLFAWSVHLFTASGAIFSLLAIIAITQQQWPLVFIWMAAAVAVDAFDGILARRAHVKQVLPNFNGSLLDNIIDYQNYVIVPAFFFYSAGILPEAFAVVGAGLTVLASAYQFCQEDAKTDDHYFKGFPSYWNVAVFYLFMLGLNPWLNLALVIFLCILVFVPIKYIYPTRTEANQRLTMTLAIIWALSCIAIILQYPNPDPELVWFSLLYVAYYVGLSLYHTDKGGFFRTAARRLSSR